ncbi:MAG TPA: helix-turn-helix transcriptional regulator [Clostridia bacterium]
MDSIQDLGLSPETIAIGEALRKKFGEKEYTAARARAQFKRDMCSLLRHRRTDLQLDQKSMAKMLRTTQQQLSKYETGENSPSLERLYDLCTALNLEVVIRDRIDKKELICV